MENATFLPIPELKADDIASLTVNRQKILVSLLHGEKTLIKIVKDIKTKKIQLSTALRTLKKLQEEGFVIRNEKDRIYKLTNKGKLLGLMLAEPNGMSKEELEIMQDKVFRELGLTHDERVEIIEMCKAKSESLTYQPDVD